MPRKSASSHQSDIPKEVRNHRNPCKGKAVVRYEQDVLDKDGQIIHHRHDPILDADHARQYRPCNGWGANGSDYCGAHGGSAQATILAAKRTLALAAEEFAAVLRGIAIDETLPVETRLKAAAQGLDRIGVRAGVDVSLETPKWQGILGKMFGSPEEDDEEESTPPEPPKPSTRAASAKPTRKPKL